MGQDLLIPCPPVKAGDVLKLKSSWHWHTVSINGEEQAVTANVDAPRPFPPRLKRGRR